MKSIVRSIKQVRNRGYDSDTIIMINEGIFSIPHIPQYELDYFKSYDYTSDYRMLEFKNGDRCPKNYFFWKDYIEVWKPCYGNKLKPEDCQSFEDFKDKLAVAQL